jgi:hypothetical protein
MEYELDGRGSIPGRGKRLFFYCTASRPALRPTQPPIQFVPEALSPGVKGPGREADHSPPTSAEIKNGGAIPPLPPRHDVVLNYLINYVQGNLYLIITTTTTAAAAAAAFGRKRQRMQGIIVTTIIPTSL